MFSQSKAIETPFFIKLSFAKFVYITTFSLHIKKIKVILPNFLNAVSRESTQCKYEHRMILEYYFDTVSHVVLREVGRRGPLYASCIS